MEELEQLPQLGCLEQAFARQAAAAYIRCGVAQRWRRLGLLPRLLALSHQVQLRPQLLILRPQLLVLRLCPLSVLRGLRHLPAQHEAFGGCLAGNRVSLLALTLCQAQPLQQLTRVGHGSCCLWGWQGSRACC